MKDNNKTNHTNVILNLFQDLQKDKMLKQVQHDNIKRHTEDGSPKYLYTNFENEPSPEFVSSPQLNGSLCITGREGKENRNELINLSTYRLINFKKSAFTLAEVLITLGIIGIVAAMTIPNLMTKNIQKQTVVKLQKAISIMNQAYKMSFDDVGEANTNEAFEMGADKYFETYWAPYIKTAVLCKTYQQCGYKQLNPWALPNGKDAAISLVADDSRVAFYTNDGFLYVILTASGTGAVIDGKIEYTKNSSIIVDLNGKEGPNRFGRDVFMLWRISDGGGVQPYGYNVSDATVNSSCINAWYGNTCAEKIRRAGWRIDKDYPWK